MKSPVLQHLDLRVWTSDPPPPQKKNCPRHRWIHTHDWFILFPSTMLSHTIRVPIYNYPPLSTMKPRQCPSTRTIKKHPPPVHRPNPHPSLAPPPSSFPKLAFVKASPTLTSIMHSFQHSYPQPDPYLKTQPTVALWTKPLPSYYPL